MLYKRTKYKIMRGRAVFLCSLLAIPCAYASVSLEPTRFTYGPGNASAKVHLDAFIDLVSHFSSCMNFIRSLALLIALSRQQNGIRCTERACEKISGRWALAHIYTISITISSALVRSRWSHLCHHKDIGRRVIFFMDRENLCESAFVRYFWCVIFVTSQCLYRYSNMQTKDMSAVQVINELKSLVISTFLKFPAAQWDQEMTGYGGTAADNTARVAWKYASSKGTYGTPQYHLNGKAISINGTWTVKDWCSLIDAYLKHSIPSSNIARPTQSVIVGHDTTINCRPQKHACTYLNSKSMCCNPGEQCSTQHGCLHAV